MRNIEHTHDHVRTEIENPQAGLLKSAPTALGAAFEREVPRGRNWATLLILLSVLFVQLLVIGLVIWAIFW
ncbi:hypothetical protein GCM10010520_21750 [Rhizobium viscosum]|uniref:ABC transporter ATP-binding protein n=1 Tax=Rhizobium viscosum TaxID=1673 RepID=A0ABR9IIE2_RHIVS|nr:hypothetical protein [Rhizobium viscosum]MBE1502945.1 hypothetical protein [Rhizobium viscosum]